MNNLSKFRTKAGLAQKQLGELCGFESPQARISHYENGQRNPSIDDIKIIIGALSRSGVDCTFETLFPDTEDSAA